MLESIPHTPAPTQLSTDPPSSENIYLWSQLQAKGDRFDFLRSLGVNSACSGLAASVVAGQGGPFKADRKEGRKGSGLLDAKAVNERALDCCSTLMSGRGTVPEAGELRRARGSRVGERRERLKGRGRSSW